MSIDRSARSRSMFIVHGSAIALTLFFGANEMKIVADRMGIDIYEVIDAAATKPFGFVPYYPGPGLGEMSLGQALQVAELRVGPSERARQRDLDLLALREALRAPVGEVVDLEQVDHVLGGLQHFLLVP